MSDPLLLVDAGGSNIGSVQAAFARLGVAAPLSSAPARIRAAARVVLPGAGAAAPAMQRLRDNIRAPGCCSSTLPAATCCS